ncbi:hypothetical protein [Zavarzinia sp. CC-PAN008]|uniref:hypothetical protein n=1 Tax=Zavarzinia sp. CC-PAN008 TaxID=3243332 RepID=UPI003F746697
MAVLGLALLLGACATQLSAEPPVPAPPPMTARAPASDLPVVTARTVPPLPRPRPADVPPPRPATTQAAAAPAEAPPPASAPTQAPPRVEVQAALKPPPRINPVGLDTPALLRAFGEPERRSEEPPAQVWRYGNGECAVNFYLYLDVARNQFRVVHARLAQGRPQPGAVDECLSRLAANHGQS